MLHDAHGLPELALGVWSSILLMDPGTAPYHCLLKLSEGGVAAAPSCWVKVEIAAPLPLKTLTGRAAQGQVFLVKVETTPPLAGVG